MSQEHILIVEDSLGVARALNQALSLTQGGGYHVEVSESGEAALERLRDTPFDLLISDLRLPGISGLELCEQACQIRPQMRRVLITAFGSPQVEERARQLTDAYLPKPFRLHEIIRIVQRILGESDEPGRAVATRAKEQQMEKKPPQTVSQGRALHTHLTILACGIEGTLSKDGVVDDETWKMLHQAKAAGLSIILVTGQTLDVLTATTEYTRLCEAIVAEDGAVVYFPRRDAIALPFGRLAPSVIHHLESLTIPLQRGKAIITTHVPHDMAILNALRQIGGGATVEYNRGAVMVLPPGATKGTGLCYALQEMGYSPHNVVACGDAENDHSLLEMAELAVAVSNAHPDIQARADVQLSHPDGMGIRLFIHDLLNGHIPLYRSRPSRRLSLGHRLDGAPVHVDPIALLNSNLGIFGSSGSGKSWLSGLLAEELLKQGYQICIIDPEGDYRALGAGPHSLLLGGPERLLPPVEDVLGFFECGDASLVLDLSIYGQEERIAYAASLLRALHRLRTRRGRPHWFLIDEVQNLCTGEESELLALLLTAMQSGGLGLVSYRPSLVAPAILEALDHWMLTSLHLSEDVAALGPHLCKQTGGSAALSQLSTLPIGQAYLSFSDAKQPPASTSGFVQFRVGSRTVPHIRHLRKYLQAILPEHKRFHFHDASGCYLHCTAANLWEFRHRLEDLPLDSVQYHLHRADFERWLREVLHDDELARRVHRVSQCDLAGAPLRQALLDVVIERYEELDTLA
ncbi:MAG TPA: response regulator [Chloroflexi bacterium]|nr:response regulator [Chloroflexota bacterium]